MQHTVPNAHIGQKWPMLWQVCPTDTVVPILHCELGTVNDQIFKKLFRQILSLEVGSSDELKKRTLILDYQQSLELLHESKLHLETDLLMMTYQLTKKREDLVKKRNNLKAQIRKWNRNKNNTSSIDVTTLELLHLSTVDEIKEIDNRLILKKRTLKVLIMKSSQSPSCYKNCIRK